MIGHNPCMLKITACFHWPHKIDSTIRAYLRHFKNEDLIRLVALAKEHVPLNIRSIAKALELGDTIHDIKPKQVLERGDFVCEAKGIKLLATIKDRFELLE